jgi:uncharacterized RDD family membrane protein YckC
VPPAPTRAADDLSDILAQLENEPAAGDANPIEAPATTAPNVGEVLTDPRDLARPSAASEIVIESEGGLDFDPTFAPFGKRTISIVVDTVIVSLAVLPGLVLISFGGALALVGALLALVGFVVFVGFTARGIVASGQSVGNKIADTRVVDGINGSNIDMGRAVLRTAVRHLISPILLLGFIAALPDGQRRTFHDRLAVTVVIGRPREVWTAEDG